MKRHSPAWGVAVVASIGVLALVVGTVQGAAQEREGEGIVLSVADVRDGACSPAAVEPGDLTTCRFPLARAGALDPARGPYVAGYRTSGALVTSLPCRVEGALLVCRSLRATFDLGTFEVTVRFGGRTSGPLATVTQTEGAAGPVALRLYPPVAVAGHSRPVVVEERFGFDRSAGVYAEVRADGTGEVLDRFEVKPPGAGFGLVVDPETGEEAPGFDLVVGAPGVFEVGLCVGPSLDTCNPTPLRRTIDVVSADPLEVIDGHNVSGADRIDVVIGTVGLGNPSVSALPSIRRLLGLDGPVAVDASGREVAEDPSALVYGPFAVEPLRSMLDRFNLWLLPDTLADPAALSTIFPTLYAGAVDLNAVQATVLISTRVGEGLLDETEPTTFDGELRIPDPAVDRFGTVLLYLPETAPLGVATVLTHEWGHGLFGLLDEYVDLSGRFTLRFGYPNCASSETEAVSWWGDLVGEVDPFYAQWRSDLAAVGLEVPVGEDDVRVGFVQGGCYSPGLEAVRPTVDSLMNGIVPVLGSVNRARTEEILDSFSGRLDLVTLDESFAALVGLSCDAGSVPSGGAVSCAGVFPPYVASASGGLFLLVASEVECDITPGPIEEARPFTCGPIDVAATPGVRQVMASPDGGSATSPYVPTGITVMVEAPPTTSTSTTLPATTTSVVAPSTTLAPGTETRRTPSPWLVAGGVVALLALLGLVAVGRRRSGPVRPRR